MKPELASAPPVQSGVAAGTSYSVYAPQDADAVDGDTRATVVLIHGVGMNQSVWAPQVAALRDRYRVVVYDMLGHGRSALPSPAARLDEYASQLAQLLDTLGV